MHTELEARPPIIWFESSEPHLAVDILENFYLNTERQVFRIDTVHGLVTYCKDGSWKIVLADLVNEEGETVTFPIGQEYKDIFPYVLNVKGVLLLENSHIMGDALWPWMNHVVYYWYEMLKNDDVTLKHCTIVLTGPVGSEIPATYREYSTIHSPDYPDAKEIEDFLDTTSHFIEIPLENKSALIRTLKGLSTTNIQRAVHSNLLEESALNPEYLNSKKIEILSKNSILEIRDPIYNIDQVGGMDNAKELLTSVKWIWENPEQASKFNIDPVRRIIMIGIPGTGKSMLCEAAATSLGLQLASFGISKAMNKYVGESERQMREMFKQLKALAPIVAWIDEFGRDASGSASSNSSDSGTTDRVHGEFLQGLQELPPDVFLICAANKISELPPELLRAERFDEIFFVGLPTESERQEIFKVHLSEEEKVRINSHQLSLATNGFTGAEIQSLIKRTRFNISTKEHRPLNTQDLGLAAPKMVNRIMIRRPDMVIESYERALNDWTWASSSQYEDAGRILDLARKTVKV